jgi:hypothetical protein
VLLPAVDLAGEVLWAAVLLVLHPTSSSARKAARKDNFLIALLLGVFHKQALVSLRYTAPEYAEYQYYPVEVICGSLLREPLGYRRLNLLTTINQ